MLQSHTVAPSFIPYSHVSHFITQRTENPAKVCNNNKNHFIVLLLCCYCRCCNCTSSILFKIRRKKVFFFFFFVYKNTILTHGISARYFAFCQVSNCISYESIECCDCLAVTVPYSYHEWWLQQVIVVYKI